jgi:pilus assembly protein CpaB
MTAVTIRTDDLRGVAGFLQPDDRVNVVLTRTRGDSGDKAAFADVLLRSVRVLAVDEVPEGKGQAKAGRAVTIEVTKEDAARVVLGMEIGTLAFALLGSSGGGQ